MNTLTQVMSRLETTSLKWTTVATSWDGKQTQWTKTTGKTPVFVIVVPTMSWSIIICFSEVEAKSFLVGRIKLITLVKNPNNVHKLYKESFTQERITELAEVLAKGY